MKENGEVTRALIFGGVGREREISVLSAEGLFRALRSRKADILLAFIDSKGNWFLANGKDTTPTALAASPIALGKRVYPVKKDSFGGFLSDNEFTKIDVALPILHGDFGEDGRVQGALDTAGISFVGCPTEVSAVCRNKSILKAVLSHYGTPMLEWVEIPRNATADEAIPIIEDTLGYPVFIKPTSLGSSIGATVARTHYELKKALLCTRTVSDSIMAERYLSEKRELECAFFEYKGKRYFTRPGQICYDSGFYDYESKYLTHTASISERADVSTEVCERVRELSARIADIVGLRHFARIDFFLDGDGRIYFNEINTIPGLTESSLFPLMVKGAGVDPCDLFLDLSRPNDRRI